MDCEESERKDYQNIYMKILLHELIIKRLEFTFELAWNTLKAVFEDEGLIGLNSPKTVLREALAAELIKED